MEPLHGKRFTLLQHRSKVFVFSPSPPSSSNRGLGFPVVGGVLSGGREFWESSVGGLPPTTPLSLFSMLFDGVLSPEAGWTFDNIGDTAVRAGGLEDVVVVVEAK